MWAVYGGTTVPGLCAVSGMDSQPEHSAPSLNGNNNRLSTVQIKGMQVVIIRQLSYHLTLLNVPVLMIPTLNEISGLMAILLETALVRKVVGSPIREELL